MVDELSTLSPDEPDVVQQREVIEDIIQDNVRGPLTMLHSFSEFKWLLEVDEEQYLQVSMPITALQPPK